MADASIPLTMPGERASTSWTCLLPTTLRQPNSAIWTELTRELMQRISRFQQGTTNVIFSLAQETTDGDLLGEERHWTQPLDEVSFIRVSSRGFVPSEKATYWIKQRSGMHPAILSEAKPAYPTVWAMGEEGKVVSFLRGFTDSAFAGHLLRTGRANTLRTAT